MSGTIKDIEQGLQAICKGANPETLFNNVFPDDLLPLAEAARQLDTMIKELQAYSGDITKGNLDVDPPRRSNYLAAGLKALHVQLNHLTWQAEQVAQGDYSHKVDFMGKFSTAFNTMTQQLRQREERLQNQHAVMLEIFDHLDSLIIITKSGHERPLFLNRTAFGVLGLEQMDDFDGKELPPLMAQIDEVVDNSDYGVQEIHELHSDRWYRILTTPMEWMNGANVTLSYCNDITDHKKLEDMLSKEASTDPLTGLLNRRGYDTAAGRHWATCMRSNCPITLLMLDVDHFKNYNDTYGHLQGDECLKTLAHCLRQNVNRMNDLVARVGGEEFIVLLPYADISGGKVIAEKLKQAVEQMVIAKRTSDTEVHLVDDKYRHITISIGLSTVIPNPERGKFTLESLLRQADKALYYAKEHGRKQYRVYEELDSESQRLEISV